ncbi:MAG: hypothetical protein JWM20_379 [Patescibacteria group bacterium]|nr:hypothetical protein [Patescibacteria group bacterium]
MTIRQKLHTALAESLKNLGAENVSFSLEHPTELSHGDFATNAALASAKVLAKNPREVADALVQELKNQNIAELESVHVAGPGFINFKLTDSYFQELNKTVFLEQENFGKSGVHLGKKILVEHSSPNLFKPFHIGHMMNNAIGESLVRIMKFSGANVIPISFPSDVGLGIAKAIWSVMQQEHAFLYDDSASLESKMKFLGECYAAGTRAFEDNPETVSEIRKINEEIYRAENTPAFELYLHTKKLNVHYFENTVARLGSHFDSYIFESEAGIVGEKIIREHIGNVFKESEGAVIYVPEESTHLPTLVFMTSEGHPTYETKDMGLLSIKFDRYNPDLSAIVTDAHQVPHFDVVVDAASKIHSEWKEKSVHVPHGRMSFKGQKMSSRLGGVPLATDVLETVLAEVEERSKGRENTSTAENADAIAIAAIKFSILRTKPGQNINFDPETSLSFEGDSGPYLQYTHARIASLLDKAAGLGIAPAYKAGEPATDLERITMQFHSVVESAISEFAPQHVVTYLVELCRTFNSFYGANKIVDESDQETSAHRLAVAKAAQIVLKNGLGLLGIKAPERM